MAFLVCFDAGKLNVIKLGMRVGTGATELVGDDAVHAIFSRAFLCMILRTKTRIKTRAMRGY